MDPTSKEHLSQRLGFPVHAIRPEPISSGGSHSKIFTCDTENGDLVLRVCEGPQGWWTSYFPDLVEQRLWVDQAWAVDRARGVGVPAPEIVLSDRANRWTVAKRLPGTPIDPRYESWPTCPYDEAEFGSILRRLHSIVPSGWGPIDDDGDALFDSWASFLTAAARSALITARRHGAVTAELHVQLERHWVPRLRELDFGPPALLHMESLGFSNLLYDPDTRKITGVVDFEDCIGGDPLLEVLFMRFYFEHDDGGDYKRNAWLTQDHFDFTRFAMGYGIAEDDAGRMSLYRPFPYLDKLRWIDPHSPRAASYRNEIAESI